MPDVKLKITLQDKHVLKTLAIALKKAIMDARQASVKASFALKGK